MIDAKGRVLMSAFGPLDAEVGAQRVEWFVAMAALSTSTPSSLAAAPPADSPPIGRRSLPYPLSAARSRSFQYSLRRF
jgi:hypothetical protein